MIPLPLAIGGLALIAVMLFSKEAQGAEKLLSKFIKKGHPLVRFTAKPVVWKTFKHKNGTEKTYTRYEIEETPSEVAAEISKIVGHSVSVDAVLLATLMASEAGGGHPIAKAAIAHAALTEARGRRRSLMTQLAPDGKFGSQQGRYASTRLPPTRADIDLAEAILAGKVKNPTPGATNWDSPSGQRAAIEKKIPGYEASNTPDLVATKRIAAGKESVTVPGINPDYLRLWRPIA